MKSLLIAMSVTLLAGCASVINDTTHPIKIEVKTAEGELIKGGSCVLLNEYGPVNCLSGDTVQVRRSSKDLDITCKCPSKADANGRAISRVNGGMFGNIILGGGIWGYYRSQQGHSLYLPNVDSACSWKNVSV